MNWERFHFVVMIAAVMLQGTGLAAQATAALKPATSESSDRSADQQKDAVRNETGQAHPKEAVENREQWADVTRTTSKRRPAVSPPKPILGHPTRPAKMLTTNRGRTDTPGSVALREQTGAKAAPNVANRAVGHGRPPAPSSAVSVNGQQFKNSRDPGGRLAVSGGPPTTPRGAAAITGTNLKHKP